MDPRRLLTLANGLLRQRGPAEFRSATSRAYYAVYHVAEHFLARMGIVKKKNESNVILQRRLMNSGGSEFIRIGSELGQFHARRNQADYNMNHRPSEDEQTARASVKQAEEMIAAFDACPINGDRWKQMQAAINRVAV